MKNILHLTQTDIRSDSRILKEISAAKDFGYEVVGIGIRLGEDTAESGLVNLDKIVSIPLLSKRLVYLPKIIQHSLVFVEYFARSFVLSIRSKPDIIHCNDTLVLPIGILVKLVTGAKLVYDAHELESDRNGLSKFLGKIILRIEKVVWPLVDALIVVSPSIEEWYMNNVGKKSCAVVLNSPIIETQSELKHEDYLRDQFGIPKDVKIFIYVGILAPGRGIDLIIDAFTSPDIKSSVVFLGYGPLTKELKDKSEQFRNIHVHDAVEHEKVVSIVRTADVGLCLIQNISLSDYYSLPNKLFEYCFSGIPVLASNFPDMSEVVNKYKLGICVDLNVEDVVEGIKGFERGELDVNFSSSDLTELGWKTQANKLIQLYQNVLL